LPAEPKIHCRRRKEKRREGRIPRAVKDVAGDYEEILPCIPGMYAPKGGDDDYKKDDERERIEKHYGCAICLFKRHIDCEHILPELTESCAPKFLVEHFG